MIIKILESNNIEYDSNNNDSSIRMMRTIIIMGGEIRQN